MAQWLERGEARLDEVCPAPQGTVVVLGSPRSGTSLTAGVLQALGVDMGDIRPPDSQNPKGYYEDRTFLALGKLIFQAAEENASGFNLPDLTAILDQEAKFRDRICKAVVHRVNAARGSHWGWKTTHTNLTLPLFMPHLDNPKLVIVFRNPLNTAKSMIKFTTTKSHLYSPLDIEGALKVVHEYYHGINYIIGSYDVPRRFIAYEELIHEPESEIRSLCDFLGIRVDRETLAKAMSMVASRSDLRRAHYALLIAKSAMRLRKLPGKVLSNIHK